MGWLVQVDTMRVAAAGKVHRPCNLFGTGHTMEQTSATTAALFVAFELSKKTWVLASSRRFRIGSASTGLRVETQRLSGHLLSAFGPRLKVHLEYRSRWSAATSRSRRLHRFLTEQTVCNYVIDPASIHVSRRARAKTHRLDAETLARVLMAYCRGERQACSMARVPSIEESTANGRVGSASALSTPEPGT